MDVASGGLRRLQHRVATGRPSKLTPTQKRTLKQQLRKGALTAGFPTDRWMLERIAALIKQEFGVRYHPHYLSRLLRQLGFTLQTPQPAAAERDDELIHAWLRHDWPRIKKSAAARRRDHFYDETGFSFLAPLARTWAPCAKRPALRRVTSERRVISTVIGLTLSGKIYKRHFGKPMNSDCVIMALEQIERLIKGKWILM